MFCYENFHTDKTGYVNCMRNNEKFVNIEKKKYNYELNFMNNKMNECFREAFKK